jgi:hypothetical protein
LERLKNWKCPNAKSNPQMPSDSFTLDDTTPHSGVTLSAGNTAIIRDQSSGWVTIRATRPLSSACRTFAVRVVDVGQSSDGSGLMIGLLPRLPAAAVALLGTKYISELGGWCLSRAGDSYGSWKLADRIPFVSGSVIEFELDAAAKTVHIVCGRESTVGHIAALADNEELFPAISLYYAGQRVVML